MNYYAFQKTSKDTQSKIDKLKPFHVILCA